MQFRRCLAEFLPDVWLTVVMLRVSIGVENGVTERATVTVYVERTRKEVRTQHYHTADVWSGKKTLDPITLRVNSSWHMLRCQRRLPRDPVQTRSGGGLSRHRGGCCSIPATTADTDMALDQPQKE